MKKLIIWAVLICSVTSLKAQNVAVGIHSGFSVYLNSGSYLGVPVGVNAEWAFDSKHSFNGKAQFNFGVGDNSISHFYIAPEYKYHVVGESLDGFYIGSFLGFGGGSGTGYIAIGAVTGYSFFVGDKINLEANIQVGYGNFATFNTHVLHLIPSFGARWTF